MKFDKSKLNLEGTLANPLDYEMALADLSLATRDCAAAARKGTPVAELYQAALGLMPPEARRKMAPAILEAALHLSPDSHELRMSLAGEFLMQKEYDKSYLELKKPKSIKPAEIDHFSLYIQAAWWSKRYPEAQNAAAHCVRIAKTPESIERAAHLQRLAEMREPQPAQERTLAYVPPPPPDLAGNLPPRQ